MNAFLALDRKLASARHYPAIGYLTSYSGYVKSLEDFYAQEVAEDLPQIRERMLKVLHEEEKLNAIVQLVGEDVLPDDQRITLEIAKVIKRGFLQQNAMHENDTFVPLNKQYEMLKTIDHLDKRAKEAQAEAIPLNEIKNAELFDEIIKMKYTVPNDDLTVLDDLNYKIDQYFDNLINKYEKGRM